MVLTGDKPIARNISKSRRPVVVINCFLCTLVVITFVGFLIAIYLLGAKLSDLSIGSTEILYVISVSALGKTIMDID